MDPPSSAWYHCAEMGTGHSRADTGTGACSAGAAQHNRAGGATPASHGLRDWNDSRGKGMEADPCSAQHCPFPALSALLHTVHGTRHYLTAAQPQHRRAAVAQLSTEHCTHSRKEPAASSRLGHPPLPQPCPISSASPMELFSCSQASIS